MVLARPSILVASLIAVALAGCLGSEGVSEKDATDAIPPLVGVVNVDVTNTLSFTESVVTPAEGIAADLYEPTMEVSDTGTIYVAGHVIAAATTGTPTYYSRDDGQTWEVLPFAADLQSPPPVQGSQPPPGDEGFIVAGEDGRAWMADIYAAGFTISGWCDDGAELCYDNRYAYDRTATVNVDCPRAVASLNDRPWAATANGSLLLVNNPGGGPMQIGAMDVPPATPVGGFDPVTGPTWNLCASPGGGIPGIPAMRDDGFFAVPQFDGKMLQLVTGNTDDIFDVQVHEVFESGSAGGGTSNGGRTAFGADSTLFVAARNNSVDEDGKLDEGRFKVAVSQDDGASFVDVTFVTGETAVRSLYLDNNMAGPGALLTWSQVNADDDTRSDWYVAHLTVGPHGEPVLEHVSLAVEAGPHSSAHVMGAAAGPDGRAYFLNFYGNDDPVAYFGSTPITVWIQQDGPTLTVS